MRLRAFFLLSMLSTAVATASEEKSASSQEVDAVSNGAQELAQRLNTIHQCKETVWPRLKLGEYPMYAVDSSTSPVSVSGLDVKSGQLVDVPSDTRAYVAANHLAPFDAKVPGKDGKTGVAVNLKPNVGSRYFDTDLCPKEVKAYEAINPVNTPPSDPLSRPLDLLTHEAYHGVDQDPAHKCNAHNGTGWARPMGPRTYNGSDADKSEISLSRAHIMHYLKQAAENPLQRKQALSEAILWYRRLKEKFPDAVKTLNLVDRREGSASYVGIKSAAIAKVGCNASKDALKKAMLEIGRHRFSDVPMDHDRQSYGLGTLAGMVLDEMGYNNWKSETTAGKSPLDVLSETQKGMPKRTPRPVDSIMKNKRIFDAAKHCLSREYLKPIQTAYENPKDYVAISVSMATATGMSGDPIKYGSRDWNPNVSFQGPSTLKNWPTTMDTTKSCIQGPRMIVLVPRSSLKTDGSFTASRGEASASGSLGSGGAQSSRFDNFDFYCGS